ncbi:MAG TPA: 16S rRNA (uracil(1498)-N(3))-methyltransferase, partial [Polyangiaceae bacterium]|nr:16S rRNA (uracil(1498)-N(3))-methyltransferase [Polyangiaceae bacterium]
ISLCLWERAIDSIGPVLATLAPMQPVTIAVGSEGGLEIEETNLARSLGYAVVSLGPLILRTETVATAVLGAVLVLSAVRKA